MRFRTTRRFFLIALVLLPLLGSAPDAPAQVSSQRIAAVVNDSVITTQDLIDRIDLAMVTSGLPNDPETRRRLAPQVLRGYIDETLQQQEAKRLGLNVTEAEIDQAMDTIAQRNNTTREGLVRYLAERNIGERTLRQQIRAQIAWIKVVNREVRSRLAVTQEQIDLAMRAGGAAGDTELLVSEIVLPVYDRAQEATILAQGRDLVATLRSGTNFAALARQVSGAASAEAGGDLGWVRAGAVLPELRERLLALKPGEVSDPVVSPAGVHIFQLRDRRSAVAATSGPADRERVRQRLEQEQMERLATRYLRNLRKDAFIDVRL